MGSKFSFGTHMSSGKVNLMDTQNFKSFDFCKLKKFTEIKSQNCFIINSWKRKAITLLLLKITEKCFSWCYVFLQFKTYLSLF